MHRFIALLVLATLAAACSDSEPAPSATTPPPAATTAPATTSGPTSTTTLPPEPVATTSAPLVATTAPEAPEFPVSVAHDAGTAVVPSLPTRIAALSATHVEMLFAIGAGEQVVAGDLFSNHPPEGVADLELVDSFNVNVEAVVDLAPDLVVLSFDPGGVVAALEAVGIPVLLLGTAADLDEVYDQIEALGAATGRSDEASALVADMADRIGAIVDEAATTASGVTFYHESDPFSYYTPNSSSFIGSLYSLLGMVNIADEAPDEFSSGFPQLSAEFIVASDPDVVYLAGFGETPETFGAREGWESMTAISSGNVVLLDYDTASRWGPRVVDLLEAIAAGVVGQG